MILTNNHREALLEQLDRVNEKLNTTKRILDKSTDSILIEFYEVELVLLQNAESFIKNSLIKNEIDY